MHIIKGDIYRDVLRWTTSECVLVPATVVPGAPVVLNAVGHGLVDGIRVNIEDHDSFSPMERHPVKVIDVDTVSLPCVNGLKFRAGAAVIRYKKPVDLDGYGARQQIRDPVTDEVLLELTHTAAAGQPRIIIDNVAKTITREIPASKTAEIDWMRGRYDLEMYVIADPEDVTKIDRGMAEVDSEVTR